MCVWQAENGAMKPSGMTALPIQRHHVALSGTNRGVRFMIALEIKNKKNEN